MFAPIARDGQRLVSPAPSLTTTIDDLGTAELRFCDDVIAAVSPRTANGFPSLRAAYEQQVLSASARAAKGKDKATHRGLPSSHVDYHRAWEALVKLTKVRGTSWPQRWQVLREGQRPEQGSVRLGREEEDGSSSTVDESDEDTARRHVTHSTESRRNDNLDSPSAYAAERRRKVSAQDIEALRSRMATLSAEATSLAGSLMGGRDTDADEARYTPDGTMSPFQQEWQSSARPRQHRLRFALSGQEVESNSKATTVESASDEDMPVRKSIAERRATVTVPPKSSRRFSEVVMRSRRERKANAHEQEVALEAAQDRRVQHLAAIADHKYVGDLLRKSIIWWSCSTQRRETLTTRASSFRRASLLSKACHAWHVAEQRKAALRRSAHTVDRVRCKLRAWRTWSRRFHEVRHNKRQERRMELRGAFEVTRSRLEHRLLDECFQSWKQQHLDLRADLFQRSRLIGTAFAYWRTLAGREADLTQRFYQHREERQQHMLANCWIVWRRRSQDRRHEERLESIADAWRARRLEQITLRAWITTFVRVDMLRERALTIRQEQESALVAGALKAWRIAMREAQLVRATDAIRLSSALRSWQARWSSSESRRAAAEYEVIAMRKRNMLRSYLQRWSELTHQSCAATAMVAARRDRRTKQDVVLAWKATYDRRREQHLRAEASHDASLTYNTLWRWRMHLLENRAHAVIAARNIKSKRACFSIWRARKEEQQRESLAVATMRSKHERRIRQQVLQTWTSRVIERKSLQMEAAEARDAKLLHLAWSKWVNACIRHEDLLSLCKSHIDVKSDGQTNNVFRYWLHSAMERRSRRLRLEQYEDQQRSRLLQRSLSHWHERLMEERFRPLELEALMARQFATKRTYFQVWRDTTRSLPAIQLEHARLRSHAFYHWKELLPHARMRRTALDYDRVGLLSKAFDHWKRIAKAKRALRAASRFGNPAGIRLRAAHRRSSGSTTGGAFGRASKLLRRRSRSSTPGVHDVHVEELEGGHYQRQLDGDLSSLRASDLGSATERLPVSRRAASVADVAVRWPEIEEPELVPHAASKALSPPPALRRWILGVSQSVAASPTAGRNGSKDSPHRLSRARSEQAGSPLAVRSSRPRPRTPSPTASHTQSEVTVRIRNSPRKAARGERLSTQATRDEDGNARPVPSSEGFRHAVEALRLRRRRQSMEAGGDR